MLFFVRNLEVKNCAAGNEQDVCLMHITSSDEIFSKYLKYEQNHGL